MSIRRPRGMHVAAEVYRPTISSPLARGDTQLVGENETLNRLKGVRYRRGAHWRSIRRPRGLLLTGRACTRQFVALVTDRRPTNVTVIAPRRYDRRQASIDDNAFNHAPSRYSNARYRFGEPYIQSRPSRR